MKPRPLWMFVLVSALWSGLLVAWAAGGEPGVRRASSPAALPAGQERPPASQVPARSRGAIQFTRAYTNAEALAIPDSLCPALVTSTLEVPDAFAVGDLDVGLWVEHTWRGDLKIVLTAPDGTAIGLLNHPDGGADNLNVRLDDSSPNDPDGLDHAAPPPYYTAWWHANDRLSQVRFKDAQGTWSLALCDDAAGDEGTLHTWTLLFRDGLMLEPPVQTGTRCPGTSLEYDIVVVNATGVTQAFALDYQSSWPATGPSVTEVLTGSSVSTVTVLVTVPWYAQALARDVLTVTAAGQDGSTAQATVTTLAAVAGGYQDVAGLPEGRRTYDHSAVYWDGKLYRIGGTAGGSQSSLDILDTATNVWAQGADVPAPRARIDGAAIDGRIYVAGGYSTWAETSLYVYDTVAGIWSEGAPLPEARHGYAGAALDGRYYVVGGSNGQAYVDTLWAYDPGADIWDTGLPPMSVPRRYASAGVVGGRLYVAGGMAAAGTYVNSTEVYDPALQAWSTVAPLPVQGWVRAADGVLADRYLILAGGYTTDVTASAQALVYDAETDQWAWLPTLAHQLYAAAGDGSGTSFWIVSGRLYENEAWSYSPYTTRLLRCLPCDPVSGADFSWQPTSPRAGAPVQFTAAADGSPPIAWSWQFGDGAAANGNPVQHVFTSPGGYAVALTATNCGQQVVEHLVDVLPGSIYLPLILRNSPSPP